MAIGDITAITQFKVDGWEKFHDLENDVIKVGLVTSTTTPTETTADPRWGAGGTTDWSTNEVTPGGNYSAGGSTIANPAVTIVTADAKFDGDDISILQNASNPTNARWGILYNDTDTGKRVIGFLDLGADVDLSAGDFTITWNASGILTKA